MRSKRLFLFTALLGLAALSLAACSSVPTPAPTSTPPPNPVSSPIKPVLPTGNNSDKGGSSPADFEAQSNSGGSVTVDVKPTDLAVGEPAVFDIAMNTHSVDLSDDMTKIAILRDDTGKEYQATAWDGPASGGHHRSGTLTFPAITSKPKYVELVIKGLAKVPERVFKWDLP